LAFAVAYNSQKAAGPADGPVFWQDAHPYRWGLSLGTPFVGNLTLEPVQAALSARSLQTDLSEISPERLSLQTDLSEISPERL